MEASIKDPSGTDQSQASESPGGHAPRTICSLLPSATEIVCALGLFDRLVAVSHECDFPPEVRSLPAITRSRLATAGLTGSEIDAAVDDGLSGHGGLYKLDETLLGQLDPDLVLTQELCEVCAVSYEQVQSAVRALRNDRTTILSLEPTSLAGVLDTILAVGSAAGCPDRAAALVDTLSPQFRPHPRTARRERPSVACFEWLDPPFAGGHWVPEMVQAAGGEDALAEPGERSRRLSWTEVAGIDPAICVLMPCGYDVDGAIAHYRAASLPDAWRGLRAVRSGAVYATDANAYFSRPGPRLARGIEILSEVLEATQSGRLAGQGWQRVEPV